MQPNRANGTAVASFHSFQFAFNRLLAFRRLPALQEVVEASEPLLQRRLGEIAKGLRDELAVLVEIFDALGDDAGADAIDVDLAYALAGRQRQARLIDDGFAVAGLIERLAVLVESVSRVVGWCDRISTPG